MKAPEINGRALEMLSAMASDPGRPGTFYADRLGCSNSNAIQIRNRLRDLHLIEKHGDGRACRWTPTPSGLELVNGTPSPEPRPSLPAPEPAKLEPARPEDGPGPSPRAAATKAQARMKKALKRRRDEVETELLSTKIKLVELRAVRATLDDELEAMEGR